MKKTTGIRRDAFFWSQMILTLLCCAFLMLPVVQTVMTAFMANAFKGFSGGFTTDWLVKVITLYGDTIWRSFYLAVSVLVVCCIIGVPAAYAIVKAGKARWAWMTEEALVLPLSVPGMAIGLGILLTWGSVSWFRHSWLFLLAGHTIFCLPFMVRSVTAVLRIVPMNDYEEAAATLGAGPLACFWQIIVPLAWPGILAGALMVMTLSIGEFNISWMLQTPYTRTLPVGMADSYASMRLEIGSAYTVVFLVLIVPMLALMQRIPVLLQRRTESKFAQKASGKIMSNTEVRTPVAIRSLAEPVSIDLENCSKTYGNTMVLKPFSLHIETGRKLVLLGPSGCGKTTTLRIIAGLETPDEGSKVFLGKNDVTRVAVEKRNVGMMFQSYALFPNMSVEDNVAYGLRLRKMDKQAMGERVQEMLNLVHMEHLRMRPVTSLSGGQRQRVALARALAIRPRVLLLDEPLTALDALLRVSVREELDQLLAQLGITTVIVTHDQEEAMSLGDQIVIMQNGRIVQNGTPEEIYHQPASAFVAGFVGGSNSMLATLDSDFLRLPGGGALPRALFNGTGNLGNGDVDAFFRPDRASLHFGDDRPELPRGEVLTARFLGDRTRVSVLLDDDHTIKIDMPNQQVSIATGTHVSVNIQPESVMIFPVE